MSFAADLQDRLAPRMTPHLEAYLDAIAEMAEPLVSIIEGAEDLPEWGAILSPAEFPNSEAFPKPAFPQRYDPGYLGQFVGVSVPSQYDYAQAISLIREELGFARGTSEAIRKAVARVLKPGATTPRILSRQNANGETKAYWFVVVVAGKDVEGSIVTTGNITSGSAKIKSIPNTAGMQGGDPVIALGFSPPPTIKEVNSSTEITLTATASVSTEGTQVIVVDQAGIAVVENNIREAKPAGLRFAVVYEATWEQVEGEWATWKALEEHYEHSTWARLELEG